MARKEAGQEQSDREVEEILKGLTGADDGIRVGKKYYFFTVTYHYIGKVAAVLEKTVILADGSMIVGSAGSQADTMTKIVTGKGKPEKYEALPKPIGILKHSMTSWVLMDE